MVTSKLWVRTLAIAALLLGGFNSGAAAATKTWTGAVNALWSTSGNWTGGTPVAGDRIAFPTSSSNPTNTNDLAAGTVFFDITFLGSNYIINGNTIGLSDGIPANNGFNNRINADLQLTAPQSLQGAFCCAGLTLAGNIDIGANATTISGATVLGVISGTGPLTVGDVTNFTANNSYTGLTTVSGRGQIDGSQPQSDVQLAPSFIARLSGDGTVGSVTTASSSYLTPGAGLGGAPGKLTVNDLNFGNGSSYEVQLNGPVAATGYDQVVTNGTVTIGSGVGLNLALNYSPSNGQVLTLIDNDGVDAVAGTFNGMPEGTTLTMNASDFQISYVGGSGNDVVLTVTAAAKTWTGAVNGLWSVAGNWQGGVPGAGDPLVFPNGASNLTNSNDLPAATVYKVLLFTGSNYIINGNTIGLSNGIPGGNGFNNRVNADLQLTAPQTLQGAFCCAGLTLGNIAIGANATTITGATVLGVISGTGPLTMGDVTNFTGNNTYTGLTTVSGRAQVDGSQPQSDVQLTASFIARLSGDGTVGSVTTASSSMVTPGAGLGGGPGKLTVNDLNFGNSSSYEVQLNGAVAGTGYDQVVTNGTVTIGSGVGLNLALNYSPSNGQVLTLIDNDGVDAVSGTFNGMPEGTTVTMNASDFQISYVGGSGNDVVLTVTAAAKTWTGAVNGLWSVAGNWQGGVPAAGDPLVFPNGASNLTNTNDLPAATVYKVLLFTGSNYIINGNAIGLSDGIPGGNGFNNRVNADLQLTAPQTLQGAFCCAGLTLGNIAIGANATTITGATVLGVISGTGPVTMGDVTNFQGNNTYTGLTTVGGRGQVDGSQPQSDVQLTASFIARLSGNGTVGSVTTSSSSYLTPGAGLGGGPGKLTMNSLTFGNSSTYEVQLNGSLPGAGYDQVSVTGAVAIGGGVGLNVSLGFTPSLGQIFVIALNDGADAVSGTFNGLPQNTIFNLGPYPFEISYIGKTGNEIILTSLSGDSLNNPPVAVADSFAVPQNTSLSIGAPGLLLNDSDADLDAITVVQAPSTTTKGGTLTVNADGSFLYQPPVGFVGFDDFTYIISDGNDATDLANVIINVQDIVPPSVTVNSPNGGQILIVGTTAKLDWTVTDKKPVSVDLYISRDNGSTYEKVASAIPNSGTYSWVVTGPGTNVDASPVFSALFKVDARDSSNNISSDVSDSTFAIQDVVTASTLAMFQATAVGDGIELRWRLGDPGLFASVAIERGASQTGPWAEVSLDRREEGGMTVASDRAVEPDQTYFYRLIGTAPDGKRVTLGQLSGSARLVIREFAISRVAPNPSRGAMRIEYALPGESHVRLSVMDIQGREVVVLAEGVFKAGRYQTTWTGQTDRGDAPAGVYFVRCQALGKNLTERVVRVR